MANPLHVRQRLNLAITRPDGQFRILSLDGGGTKGLIETAALQRLYPGMGGREILKKFDLVIGTSAGSMLIAALLTNAPLDVVLSEMTATHDAIFKTRTPSFCSLPGIGAYIQSLIVAPLAKYWQSAKQPGLRMLLDRLSAKAVPGTPPISESLPGITSIADVPVRRIPELLGQLAGAAREAHRTDVIITAFDYDRSKTVLFRSHAVLGAPGGIDDLLDITVVEAIDASSNAPVAFFDAPAAVTSSRPGRHVYRFWDGGITGLVNPVERGVMEALFAGVPKKHIKVLSLGTATVKTPHEGDIVGRYGEHLNMDDCAFAPQRKESALGDLLLLSSAVLVVPADAATYSAWCILSPDPDLAEHQHRSSAVIRLSPFLSSVEYDADGHVIVREPPLAEGHVAALAEPPRSIKTLGPEITGPAATPGALPPYRLSKAGFEAFAAMALDTNAVDVIRAVADAWMKDKLLNEPVVDGVVGRRVFSEAAAEWHAFGER